MRKLTALAAATLLALTAPTACRRSPPSAGQGRPFIIATYSVLGALVRDLVGDAFVVISAVPNGLDPHEWEPSARDIEALNAAALVVENGLGLEEGMEKVLESRRSSGRRVFTAADHVAVRTVGEGEGIPSGDPDQKVGASDPHLWTDPVAMKSVAIALAAEIQSSFGVNLGPRAADLAARLDALDAEIRAAVDLIPASRRKLVTGHESLGYLARRYGFTLVGAVVPGLSTAAEVSAAELASLKALIQANGVAVIFTEVGTPPGVSQALAREAHVRAVELTTHGLPADGSYFTYMRDLARVIAENLK